MFYGSDCVTRAVSQNEGMLVICDGGICQHPRQHSTIRCQSRKLFVLDQRFLDLLGQHCGQSDRFSEYH
jgi:hypothetical protein